MAKEITMDKSEDNRNWRCLFGWHQWEVISEKTFAIYAHANSPHPYKETQRFILRCIHCGDLKKRSL